MSKLTTARKGLVFISMMAAASMTMAAQDGVLGAAASEGELDVTIEIADRVQISNMKDITIGSYAGSGNVTESTTFCVYRNGGDQYQLTMTSDTSGFALASTTTSDSIPFTTRIDDDMDASDGQSLDHGVASLAMSGAASTNCGGSDNASLEVTFAESDLQAASSANDYRATMTVLVEPI